MDMNTLRTMVTEAVVATQRSKDKVQAAALACIEHASLHGDVSELQRLSNGIGYGKLVFKRWVEAHSPIKFGKAKNNDFVLTCKGWKDGGFDLAGLKSTRWDDFMRESEPKPLTMDNVVHYLKLVADGKKKASPEAQEAAIKALAAIA